MQNKKSVGQPASRKNIHPKLFDIFPVMENGDLDMDKINGIRRSVDVTDEKITKENESVPFADIKKPDIEMEEARRFRRLLELEAEKRAKEEAAKKPLNENITVIYDYEPAVQIVPHYTAPPMPDENEIFAEPEEARTSESMSHAAGLLAGWQLAFSWARTAVVVVLAVGGTIFVQKGLEIKDSVQNNGKSAFVNLAQAKEQILNKNFRGSQAEFAEAFSRFDDISKELDSFGGILIATTRYIPYLSKLSTGAALAQAGKDISRTGVLAGQILQTLDSLKNPAGPENSGNDPVSLLKIFQDTNKNILEIQQLLTDAENNINKVNVDDIPEEQRAPFVELKNKLPEINNFLTVLVNNNQIFTDVLGGNGPRKYLFLFQNNQEMRATGGFIGTYGVLDMFNGHVQKFFVDGIFNPDGQLKEKVVPPVPIQKISAVWSLHDSNWFPDFPVSAEKATWFYEKTGGPTVDGVITMTPAVMQKLLEVTGPIDLPDYGITIDKDNFLEKLQQEIEVDYDKDLNQPKKILADLAPKILDEIFNARNFSDIARTMDILTESLNEKQILIYSKNYEIEKKLSGLGWTGEVLETQKDYLSVINTNINGFKTDGVIDEKIDHAAEIQNDGSVVDTVTVTRHHNGGNSEFSWWNKVNADYMRVYVPLGSKLLSAEGQTREFDTPPLDYDALGFKHDAQVRTEEEGIEMDPDSGTRVYDDAGKTVFANWAYVSPQETVTIKYKYLLPFKVSLDGARNPIGTYSLLAQKQSGSRGSQFASEISFPENYRINWKYPDEARVEGNKLKLETDLRTDKFFGVAFLSDK